MATLLLLLCVFTYGSFALENIVTKIQTWVHMSSTFENYLGKRITDGNTDQNIGNCSHTDPGLTRDEAWVRVDLGRKYSIAKLKIYYRNDRPTSRFDQFYVDVLNDTRTSGQRKRCYKDTQPGLPSTIVNIECKQRARLVRIGSRHRAGGEPPMLEICEIEVWVNCRSGYYGKGCSERCSHGCIGRDCDPFTGACSRGCIDKHLERPKCFECENGYYRRKLLQYSRPEYNCLKCSSHCKNGHVCNRRSGHCKFGCDPGWRGKQCLYECKEGYFGANCTSTCSPNCERGICNSESGICDCKQGYTGNLCQDCTRGFYKENARCVQCGYCKRGGLCSSHSGRCTEGCAPGWIGTKCDQTCNPGNYGKDCRLKCSQHCRYPSCNHTSGDCFWNQCKPKWTGRKCDTCQDRYYMKHSSCIMCSIKCKRQSCNSTNGWCTDGCVIGWSGPTCSESCPFGSYGQDCSRRCTGKCQNNETCNKVNGTCRNGCISGYKGPLCDQKCGKRNFGENCRFTCKPGCRGDECHPETGNCDCKRGYTGQMCEECGSGYYKKYKYSNRCHRCPTYCKAGTVCNKNNGHCESGCQNGWKGQQCTEQCDIGFFGADCNTTCSPNCISRTCNPQSGTCNCRHGSSGHTCQDCISGFYNENAKCVECGQCKYEGNCSTKTGECKGGCNPGWSGIKCNLHCADGSYGNGCLSRCSPGCPYTRCHHISGDCDWWGCKSGWTGRRCDWCGDRFYMRNGLCISCNSKCNKQSCSNTTGWCTDGCIAGWSGHACNESCPFGSYGKDCSKRCIGKCVNNETCNTINGTCAHGCMPGYLGQFCDQTCVSGSFGLECASTCGRCNSGTSCDPKNGFCSGGCIHGWYEPLCHKACKDGTYGLNCRMTCSANCINGSICLHTNGTCLQGCNFGFEGHDCKTISVPVSSSLSEGSSAAIGSAIGTVAMFLISIIIGIIIYRSRRAKTISKTEQSRLNSGVTGTVCYSKPDICTTTINNAATGSAGEDTNDVLYYNEMNIAKDVLVTELTQVIKNMETDTSDGFEKEFKVLPFGERFDCSAAKLQENMLKNRFKTTFPYDHSRVVLRPNGPYSSDYINANYIEDMFGQRHYIASQGPRINTVLDHWRLIWQEKIGKIVMLTGLIENQRVKCEQYWPNKDSDMIHGQWIIKLTEEKKYANYVIRKLEVADQSTKEKRMITHFHYTQWPDHGTPDPVHLVEFYRNVVRIGTGNVPLLVHCSAGLGRTGTFIALDALSRYGTMNGKVNVPEYVKVMRKDRMNMIQNSDQYAFLYHALHESFSCGGHILTREEVTNSAEKVQTSTSYRVEFDKLKTLKPVYKERDFCAGRENRSLNFTQNVLPLDKYRVYLPITVLGKGDYYNAVVLPSFTRPSAIIAAQFPAAGNGVDLARLLVNMEVGLLISTSDLSNMKSISDWVNDKTGTIDVKNYRIKNDSCKMLSDEIRNTVLTVQELDSDVTQKVQCLELMSWRMDKKTPPDSNCIIEVIRYIETQRLTLPDSCVTVMSKDGASGCGLICAMYNASQQLSMDDEVDLFSIVRQLQIRRPEMFSSYEEYEFLYKTLQKYLTSDNIYANA